MRMFTKFSLLVAILSTGPLFGEEPVYFVDQNLKASVEADLQILDPTPSDMLQLTGFSCRHSNIKDLTGLDYAINLESLSLSFNEIESISPLSDLSNLESVTINDNQIRSISPLGGLEKLYDLDVHNNVNEIGVNEYENQRAKKALAGIADDGRLHVGNYVLRLAAFPRGAKG